MKRCLVLTLALLMGAVPAAGLVTRSAAAPVSRSGAEQSIPLLRVGTLTPLRATLDPAPISGNSWGPLYVLETLLKLDPDGSIKPNLAVKVTQPNLFTYVYTLRRGVKFWNGNEMTAADVAASLNYQRHPTATTTTRYASVRNIVAKNRYTVVVTLKRRDAAWIRRLAWTGTIFEKKFFEEHKGTMGNPGVLIIGTGPWKVDSFVPTRSLELSANPNYWRGKPNIQRISVRPFADETSMALAFRAGEIDVAFPGNARAFAATSGAKVIGAPTYNVTNFAMNVTVPPWNDVHVRRAVAYAINKADIIRAIGGHAQPISTVIPPSQLRNIASKAEVDKLLKSLPSLSFNLAKARAELAKSAYPNGFRASTDTIAAHSEVNQALAGQLAKIGINLEINIVPPGQWFSAILGKTLGALVFPAGQIDPDPSIWPTRILGSNTIPRSGFNVAKYAPPAVDALIKEGITTLDSKKRLAIYGKLLKRLATDVPYVPISNPNANLVLSSKFVWPRFAYINTFPQQWPLELKAAK